MAEMNNEHLKILAEVIECPVKLITDGVVELFELDEVLKAMQKLQELHDIKNTK